MVAKQMGRRKVSGRRGKKGRRPARMSATWEEHNERVRLAVALATERFLREHEDKIRESSSESAARNSYVSGLIDMLSIARGTFGFWGADNILNELERINRKFAPAIPDRGSDGEFEDERGMGPTGPVDGSVVPATTVGGEAAKASKGVRRDPMFA